MIGCMDQVAAPKAPVAWADEFNGSAGIAHLIFAWMESSRVMPPTTHSAASVPLDLGQRIVEAAQAAAKLHRNR